MKKIGIYKITSPKKKIYIGQSIDIEYRWKKYKILNCKSQQKLYNSFLKYGVHKHKFEIVQLCEIEQLNELEKYYVDLFQTFNSKYGLNIQDGGGGVGSMSEETKRKISLSNLGKKRTDETKLKISLAKQNISDETRCKMSISQRKKAKMSEETIRRMSESSKGMKHSIETKINMSKTRKGIKHSEESKLKMSNSHKGKQTSLGRKHSEETKRKIGDKSKKIIINIETGIFYFGIQEVSLIYKINHSTLRNKLNGSTKNNTNFRYV